MFKNNKSFNRVSKGQMEIIGLVIIVLIISVAMMVYLSYANSSHRSTKTTIYKTYSQNELSTSFINTLLDTSVENCGDVTVRYLITDCGTRNRAVCSGNQKTSCELLDDILVDVKNQTLDKWDFAYGLSINFTTSKPPIEYVKYNCTKQTVGRGAPGLFLLSYYPTPGNAIIELGICG
jgi:hypothetical protein